jgi:uncharacterized protein (DUF1684 family)
MNEIKRNEFMKNRLFIFSCIVFMAIGCRSTQRRDSSGMSAAKPVVLDHASGENIRKEIEKERNETREWLRTSPASYLAAVDRIDFGPKRTLTIGKAADNDVHLNASDIESHHLRVTVEGDRFNIAAVDLKATFTIKDGAKKEAVVDPSTIQVGRYRLRLSHQRFPAIIVFDPQSPHLKNYKGVEYFPIDFYYRYELPLKLDSRQEKITIMSTRGNRRTAERIGWFDFYVGERAYRLEATRLLEPGSKEDNVSIFFKDATSGKETYPLGRYVDAKKLSNGKYLLDFNLAYNPACAFSEYYNCPVPPKENRLSVAIQAGEKDSHYH